MIALALVLSLLGQAPAQPDCSTSSHGGPDFMAMLGGSARGRLDGTIVDPPAPKERAPTPGSASRVPADGPLPSGTGKGSSSSRAPVASQGEADVAAGTCSATADPA
jgi:hypothetical protein